MNIEPLRKLGLTEGEIKVYLASVQLGESTSGPIIEKSGNQRINYLNYLEFFKD